jgi:hypothetical protein
VPQGSAQSVAALAHTPPPRSLPPGVRDTPTQRARYAATMMAPWMARVLSSTPLDAAEAAAAQREVRFGGCVRSSLTRTRRAAAELGFSRVQKGVNRRWFLERE